MCRLFLISVASYLAPVPKTDGILLTINNLTVYSNYILAALVFALEIIFLFYLIRRLTRVNKIKNEKVESELGAMSAIASYDMIKKFLRLCGVYFFVEKKGRIIITNTNRLEAQAVASRLLQVEDVSELLKTKEEGAHLLEIRTSLSDDGEQHWYEMRVNATRGFRGKIIRSGILIPIDARKQEESELLEMHRRSLNAQERDDFVHEMNHMIRTPLNAIVGFSEILADPDYELDDEEIELYEESIEENADKLLKIIEDVLTYSHMENENIFLDNKQIRLSEVFAQALEEDKEALEDAGIDIVPEDCPEDSVIYADPRIVKKVIHNLVDNVIKHASVGKELAYGWEEQKDTVEFHIKDKGPGIPENDLPFIYKAFYKVDPFSEGAGQGLAITYGYLKHENASIRCESTVGKGSSFFVKFLKDASLIMAALLFFTSCTPVAVTPLDWLVWLPVALLGCVESVLIVKVLLNRRKRFKKRFEVLEQKEIAHTLNALDGHLFKIVDDKIIVTKESAEFFSFESNEISFDKTLESMDESNREAFSAVFNAEPDKMTEVMISVPNFRTFKIVSFSVLATLMTDESGNKVPMGLFYSIEKAQSRMEKIRETFMKEEESKEKQSFLARVGHEIRTPLNAIVGFSNLLVTSHSDSSVEDKQSYAKIIRDNNELLLELLDSSLMSNQERENILRKSLVTSQISVLMEELYRTHQVIIPSRLKFNLEKGDDAFVLISRTSMRQVISNLINNACKFTDSGNITLGWRTDANWLYVYVKDTGRGIPKSDQENIFRQFYKVDSVTVGAGIGLPLSKRLVEVMGGMLTLESEVGKGSCFTIRFPKANEYNNQ